MEVQLQPFLYLPFKEQSYRISEGWDYSEEEEAIHGFEGHGAIDFELPRETPVLAAAEGWAIASYFGYPLKKEGQPVLYQGKPVGFGLGYFVQIYHPQAKLYTIYGHLEQVADAIKFHAPRGRGGYLWPVGHKIAPEKLASHRLATSVKRGQAIGLVGDSGITWGYSDFPKRPDPEHYPSWDEVHLHFEVFARVGSRQRKKFFDPFGIKSTAQDYPDSHKSGTKLGEKSPVLWILGEDGLLQFL